MTRARSDNIYRLIDIRGTVSASFFVRRVQVSAVTKRGVGRPRAKANAGSGAGREEILLAAARLFAERGFAATTTRDIAEEVGIRQPSLFYHFKKKEDILCAIIDAAAAPWLQFSARLDKQSGTAAAKLYALMRFDFEYLMTEPYRLGQLMVLPEIRAGAFRDDTERLRNRLIAAYRKLVKLGIAERDFVVADITVATHTVFGMGEALWSWYRPSRSRSPAKTAERIADLAMRALLARPSKLKSIKRAAAEF